MAFSDIVAVFALIVATTSIVVAHKIFKRSPTLQTEIFILNAYKEYVNIASNSTIHASVKTRAATQFLMAIDLYCKYVLNGHLDKKLSNDNLHFYEEVIKLFKDTIKANIADYNNIADYAEKYKISLD